MSRFVPLTAKPRFYAQPAATPCAAEANDERSLLTYEAQLATLQERFTRHGIGTAAFIVKTPSHRCGIGWRDVAKAIVIAMRSVEGARNVAALGNPDRISMQMRRASEDLMHAERVLTREERAAREVA